jgi:rubrerythrin
MINLRSPINHLIWKDPGRKARLLLRFAEVEADGGRDLVRAAETTADPTLRLLFLRHAADEAHHAWLFRTRGQDILRDLPSAPSGAAAPQWLAPGERGLDDLRVDEEADAELLAFLHLSEKAAAKDFHRYVAALSSDPSTRGVFQRVVKDEFFHMSYTRAQLLRLAPERHGWLLWRARLSRLWKGYLRVAGALAAVIGTGVLTLQYYLLLPPFALAARRAAKREPLGWTSIGPERAGPLTRQY